MRTWLEQEKALPSKGMERPGESDSGGVKCNHPCSPALDAESELGLTRAALKRALDEFESKTQDLSATNRELCSAKQELGRLNEELQTAKKALGHLSEDLVTTKAELQRKVDELAVARGAETIAHQRAQLLHLSHDAIFVWPLDGTIEYWNRGAERLYGFSAEQARGRVSHEILQTVFPQPLSAIVSDLRQGGFWTGELRQRCRDGHAVTVLSNLLMVRGEDGVERILEANRDISERKRDEDLLLEANQRLAEADQRKSEFLAVLSHELRNPLVPIRNSLHIMERVAPGSEQARRAHAIIDRQVGHLARLVDDLLDVTRVSRNKIRLRPIRVELNGLVRRTVDDHRSLFERAGISLEMHLPSEAIFVEADPERLAQVMGNLLHNAAKFTSEGGWVRVHLAHNLDTRNVALRVADNGAGIEPEMVQRLFQPFTQAETTLDRTKGGLGLGLALVKGLVELHQGKVAAFSPGPGQGSEFVIELPDATVGGPKEVPAEKTGQEPHARRVLIVEDNVDAADSLKEVLEFTGHVVEVAYSGREGLEKARRFGPEIVLCDIGLPQMDGYELAKAFKGDESLRGAVLIALSGYALPEDIRRSAEAGFAQHLAKPPNIESLEKLLHELPGPGHSGRRT
jgi:two-component system CheB/CheR fusion protein